MRRLSMEVEMCLVDCNDNCMEGMGSDEMFCEEFCREACGFYDDDERGEAAGR